MRCDVGHGEIGHDGGVPGVQSARTSWMEIGKYKQVTYIFESVVQGIICIRSVQVLRKLLVGGGYVVYLHLLTSGMGGNRTMLKSAVIIM